MSTIPAIANGGLLIYVAVALALVTLAAVSGRPHGVDAGTTVPKNNPGSALHHHDHRTTGATTNTLQSQGAVMFDSTSARLYRLEVAYPVAALRINRWGEEVLDSAFVPAAFTPTEEIPKFYWPAADRIYRSRSGVTERASLLRRYGCTVTIVEATPVWEPIPEANLRRRRERLEEHLAKVFTGAGLSVRISREA